MKNVFIVLVFIIFSVSTVKASKITVSTDIGFNAINSTSFLDIAFTNTIADTIIVDNIGMDWLTGPLDINRDDVTIIFERGVVLRALPNVFGQFDSLIRLRDRSNVTILGYGATLIMNKQEYIDLADSEFRHGVDLNSAINIWIEGLTIRDSGGDGISISKSFAANSPQNYSENITIKNCVSNNNYRQGLAIISAKDVDVLYCEFSDTSGTLPEDGIDIEPFEPDQRIENILIKGCRIINNNGNAIQVAMEFMDDSSQDISVLVEDTYMSGNHDPANTFAYAELNIDDNGGNGVDGLVTFSNCFVDSSEWTAVYISKTVESYMVNFDNCVFKDVSNDPISFNNPIFFEVTDYVNPVARFGGATFNNCTIIYDADIPFLDVIGNPSTSMGLGEVTGTFHVINPNSVSFNTGNNAQNTMINFDYYEVMPTSQISITANQINYTEDDLAFETVLNRNSTNLLPLAVNLNVLGVTTYGEDYNRHPRFEIFEFNQDEINQAIGILKDDLIEPVEQIEITLVDNECYDVTLEDEVTLFLGDSNLSIADNPSEIGVELFPNPVKDKVTIRSNRQDLYIEVYDVLGERLEELQIKNKETIDMSGYSSGLYVLKIIDQSKTNIYKVQKMIKE